MVGDVNETNVTLNNTIVFSGMVQVRFYKMEGIFFTCNLCSMQGISQIVNPTRMIGYSMACTPNTVFTGDSFEVTLPDDADSGQAFTMCVQLTSGDCMEMTSRDFTSKSITYMIMYFHTPNLTS